MDKDEISPIYNSDRTESIKSQLEYLTELVSDYSSDVGLTSLANVNYSVGESMKELIAFSEALKEFSYMPLIHYGIDTSTARDINKRQGKTRNRRRNRR